MKNFNFVCLYGVKIFCNFLFLLKLSLLIVEVFVFHSAIKFGFHYATMTLAND